MASPSPIPRISPSRQWSDTFQGFRLPFAAASLILRSPRLLALSLLAAVVTLGSLIALVVLLGQHTGNLVALVVARPVSWYGDLAWHGLVVITFVVLLVVGANTVPLAVLAPLQDPLSEAAETLCGNFVAPRFTLSRFARTAFISLGHTSARVGLLLLGHLALLPLNLVPVAGSTLWSLLSALWTMGWLAAEYLDTAMTRHHYPFRTVRRVVMTRLGLCLGFGAAVYVMLWIPILNFFFIPLAIVSGTLLFRGLLAAGALPPPPGGT